MSEVIGKIKENDNVWLLLRICIIWLCTTLAIVLIGFVYCVVTKTPESYIELMQVWDAKRYWYIVEHGYTFPNDYSGQANWAFFPVYVLVCMGIKAVTFGLVDTYLIGMIVSSVCIIIAAFYAYKWIDDDKRGMRVVILMIAGPYSFYYGAMMTEAMFVMFTVLFFYNCKKKNYLAAGIMSALASGTRIVGCVLVFSLLVEMYLDISKDMKPVEGVKHFVVTMVKTPKNIFSVLLCPLGAFAYMTFLRFFCGDAWGFKSTQIAWRNEPGFPVIGVLFDACTGRYGYNYYTYMGWMCLVFIGVYIYMFKKKYYSMATFGLITLLIALSSHVMSTCRFTVGTFVIYIGVHEIMKWLERKPQWIKWPIRGLVLAYTLILLIFWFGNSAWVM